MRKSPVYRIRAANLEVPALAICAVGSGVGHLKRRRLILVRLQLIAFIYFQRWPVVFRPYPVDRLQHRPDAHEA